MKNNKVGLFVALILVIILAGCVETGGGESNNFNDFDDGKVLNENRALSENLSNKLFSFIVYGDTQEVGDVSNSGDYLVHRKIVENIKKRDYSFIIHVGDSVHFGCQNYLWGNFKEITKGICQNKERTRNCYDSTKYLDTIYFPVIGNRDDFGECPENYFLNYPFLNKDGVNQENYSFFKENSYFIFLNSADDKVVLGGVKSWLEAELEEAKDFKFIFIIFHHTVFPSTNNPDNELIKENWVPLFEKYGVDFVLNGHNHNFARSTINGITYLTMGGGGAAISNTKLKNHTIFAQSVNHYVVFNIAEDIATIWVFGLDDNLLYEFIQSAE